MTPIHPFANYDVPALLADRARSRRDHPFLVWEPFEGEPATWTFGAFDLATRQVAVGLQRRGVKAGDFVLIHLDNCPEAVIAWYACAQAGAVAVTTNARSSLDELRYFASHSGAVAAITQPMFAELVAGAMPDARFLAVTDTDNGMPPAPGARPGRAERFEALYGDEAAFTPRPRDPLAPVGVQYTSGTTSRPKGVLWTHANALWGAKICAMHETLTPADVHLCYLPLFHTNAQSYSVLASLWAGCTVVIQPKFSASRFWPVSLKHRATWTSTIPFCVRALMNQEVPKDHTYRLWGTAISDAPWDAHFRIKTIGWWGMTETITHGIIGEAFLPNRPMAIGQPATMYDIAVVDDDGRSVEAGDSGRLKIKGVRGLSLFKEYLNNPEATAASFDEVGYVDTGDRVTLHADGFIQFADRDKDMLKVGGENVAASAIERVIAAVPGVEEVAVVAKRHPMLDEVPVAFVIPAGGLDKAAPDLAERILERCRADLADFKRPHEVRLVASLPRSTLEKIAKNQLRALL